MKKVLGYLGAVVVAVTVAGGLTVSATAPRVVNLTAGDNMKFDVATITAKPGEALKVTIKNTGTLPKEAMAHNFVLLSKKVNADAFVMDAAMAKATGYIPAKYKADVLANTTLVGPGETAEVSFMAPKVAGT